MSAVATERLCAGCGKPLVGKRRDALTHGATCRKRAERQRVRESVEPQVCPCCGDLFTRLDQVTGFCRPCTRLYETNRRAAA